MTTGLSSDHLLRSARAAQQQIELYDQILALRIQMQKVVQLSHSLPPVIRNSEENFETLFEPCVEGDVTESMRKLLVEVTSISDPNLPKSISSFSASNDLESVWEAIYEYQSDLYHSKWQRVLDRMHEKSLIGSKLPSLKTFHQSFWNKVINDLFLIVFDIMLTISFDRWITS